MTMTATLSLDTYRLLGRSGLRVSPMALGTMTFGTDWGWGADEAEARRIFDAYVDRGGNFIDTANRNTDGTRSEEHTSELQSLMRISYAVFCLKKKKNKSSRHKIL